MHSKFKHHEYNLEDKSKCYELMKREKRKAGVIFLKFYIIVTCEKDWA